MNVIISIALEERTKPFVTCFDITEGKKNESFEKYNNIFITCSPMIRYLNCIST